MIKLKNVSKSYGSKKAVDDVSFTVKQGEIFGFIGPNGAGKTTTIKIIVGMLEADSGDITVQDIDVKAKPIEAKKLIGYVSDSPYIYDKMTGIQYLNFLANIYGVGKEEREKRIKEYSEAFEMTENLNSFISSYSHGMQQKICLIGALINDPDVFILDEPMVGLDPKSSFRLKELMKERCQKGKVVFFSTHVMEVAEKLCDRIAIINNGKIVAIGTLDDIKKQVKDEGSLEKIFLELTE